MLMRMSKKEKEELILDSLLTVIVELDKTSDFLREIDYVIEENTWDKVNEYLSSKKKNGLTVKEQNKVDELMSHLKGRAESLLYRAVSDRFTEVRRKSRCKNRKKRR